MSKLKNRAKSEAMPNQLYYTLRSPKQQALQPQNKVPFKLTAWSAVQTGMNFIPKKERQPSLLKRWHSITGMFCLKATIFRLR